MTRWLGGLEPAIQFRYLKDHFIKIDITGDAEDGVARTIKIPVEAVHHLARESSQPRLPADSPPAHAVSVVEQLVERFGSNGGGVVGFALGFLDDDFHFARQLARIDHRIRVRVGLDFQPFREARGRKNRKVSRVVVDRVRVQVSAARLRFLGDVADAALAGSFEEHVLKRVRESAFGVGLVEVARLDVRDDGDDGRRMILLNENGQAVRKEGAVNAIWVHYAKLFDCN